MKKSVIILLVLFLSSCATQVKFIECISVYRQLRIAGASPNYLIIKHFGTNYELYSGGGNYGILGTFERKGDTLRLVPKYEYGSKMTKIDSADISFTTVPMLLLVKGDRLLLDLTEYEKYPELAPWVAPKTMVRDFVKIDLRKNN